MPGDVLRFDLDLATNGVQADDEDARPVSHACEGVAIAPLFVRDLHALYVPDSAGSGLGHPGQLVCAP